MGAREAIAKAITDRIRAWHASPHDFDKFELSKVGTGQGAASYGHGLYFAENPKVSGLGGEYWDEFTQKRLEQLKQSAYPQSAAYEKVTAEEIAANLLSRYGFDRNAAANAALNFAKEHKFQDTGKRLLDAADLLQSGKQVGARVYEVDIKARPEQFLDWDKPLSKQPIAPAISDVLQRSRYEGGPSFAETFGPIMDEAGTTRYGRGTDLKTGADLVNFMRQQMPGASGPKTSEMLREAGIPGIRYLDQGSRPIANLMKQEQARLDYWNSIGEVDNPQYREVAARLKNPPPTTSNYVVFDPSLIDIRNKFAVPGAVGAGAMGELARQDQYQ